MLTEEIEETVQVLPDGQLEVTSVVHILRDGEKIASAPGTRERIDVDGDLTGKSSLVTDIAGGVWTPSRRAARDAARGQGQGQG